MYVSRRYRFAFRQQAKRIKHVRLRRRRISRPIYWFKRKLQEVNCIRYATVVRAHLWQ